MHKWHKVTYFLTVVGALNWGLVGLFNWNLVEMIFGAGTMWTQWIYILVGVSAIADVWHHMEYCKDCLKMKK